jgi:hypothetical protein
VTASTGTISLDWTPNTALMGTIFLWGSYVDASNYTAILHDGTNIVFRKRIAGVNTDATKALTYAADTVYKITATYGSAMNVYVDGAVGTPHANTADLQLGTDFEVLSDGNGANQANSSGRLVKIFSNEKSASEVQAI